MPNFFDQFDTPEPGAVKQPPASGNFFDQFDEAAAPQEAAQEKSVGGFLSNAGSNLIEEGGNIAKGAAMMVNPFAMARATGQIAQGISNVTMDDVSDTASYYLNPANIPEIASDVADYAYEKPVSTALNVSAVTGVPALAIRGARAAGVAGAASPTARAVEKGLETVSRRTDPVLGAAQVAVGTGRGVAHVARGISGAASGIHQGNVAAAARAGHDAAYGGQVSRWFGLDQALGGNRKSVEVLAGRRRGDDSYSQGEVAENISKTAGAKIGERYRADKSELSTQFRAAGATPDFKALHKEVDDMVKGGEGMYEGAVPRPATPFLEETRTLIRSFTEPGVTPALLRKLPTVKVDEVIDLMKTEPSALTTAPYNMTAREVRDLSKRMDILEEQNKNFRTRFDKDMTVQDIATGYRDLRNTPEAMIELRRIIEDRGYQFGQATGDLRSTQLAAQVAERLKKNIDTQFTNAGLDPQAYSNMLNVQTAWRGLKQEFDKTFMGTSRDATTRKVDSVGRDTSHANYGERLKTLRDMVKFVEDRIPDAKHLEAAVSGAASRSPFRPGLFNTTGLGSAGLGGFFFLTGNPALAALSFAATAMHMPPVVSRLAIRAGHAKGLVVKPIQAMTNFLGRTQERWLGEKLVGARGYFGTGVQTERLLNSWKEERQQALEDAATQSAQELGYNIKDKTLKRLIADYTSGDEARFLRAMETIGRNKRLMAIFEGSGTKREQGE